MVPKASPQADRAYPLVQDFVETVRHRTGPQLETWLNEVAESHLPALALFADGVKADQAAVTAELILSRRGSVAGGHTQAIPCLGVPAW